VVVEHVQSWCARTQGTLSDRPTAGGNSTVCRNQKDIESPRNSRPDRAEPRPRVIPPRRLMVDWQRRQAMRATRWVVPLTSRVCAVAY
jgi:hypothetical protein